VAVIAGVLVAACSVAAGPAAASTSSATWSFVSAPNLHPPKVEVLKRTAGVAQGDFLAAASGSRGPGAHPQVGPMLLDDQAGPIWFLPGDGAFDLQQETYHGQPVLVWFGGNRVNKVVIYDEHYHEIAVVTARSPWTTDTHDASIIGGDLWVTVQRHVEHQNLTAYGGPRDGTVLDVGLQEFQISTGHLLRTWDALNPGGKPNVPLSASEQKAPRRSSNPGGQGANWDAYHLNSVQALPNGDLLVSMRNTWAVYLIDPITSKVLWTLGGKDSTFSLAAGVSFAWQHDAQLVDPTQGGAGQEVELTLFNDNNPGHGEEPSAGLLLALDTKTKQAKLLAAYRHYPPLSANSSGSMQLLPNGRALVGWGSEPYFSEYSPSGKELLDARWPGSDESYRTLFTDTWVGRPNYPPSGAARGSTVYASWNGATQVAKWEVLAGASASSLKVVAKDARTGFETAIKLRRRYGAYKVRALSEGGGVLGTSKAFS
jgi:hypothetical protein